MSLQLINRSSDLKRLRDEGYSLEIRANHLLVHDIPYGATKRGTLVCVLTLTGSTTAKPETHVTYFVGEEPCDEHGSPLTKIINAASTTTLANEIVVNFTFSSKPGPHGYPDYYEQITAYAKNLWHPAWSLDNGLTPMLFRPIKSDEDDSPFHYLDTASSRAGITALSERLRVARIAIIGLGGTGSYILDFIAKCPVGELHLFDADAFQSHNAFRAPGAAPIEVLDAIPMKVDYLAGVYSKMHRRIVPHPTMVTSENIGDLDSMSFVFICMDNGVTKRVIMKHLEDRGISFIDVGMGLDLEGDSLTGIVRTTTSTPSKRDHIWAGGRVSFGNGDEANEYSSNIQVTDLNALNAALAVIKWKKLQGFYADLDREYYSHYVLSGNCLRNEDCVDGSWHEARHSRRGLNPR